MSDQIYNILKEKLKEYPYLSPTLAPVLIEWIKRCDGYLIDAVLFAGEDTSVPLLIEKSIQLLDTLPKDVTNEAFCHLFAREFEGLYFHAKADQKKWNSTTESYQKFKKKLNKRPVMQYLDKPHLEANKVYEWLMLHIPQSKAGTI